MLSNAVRFKVVAPQGADAEVYQAWKASSSSCWMFPSSAFATFVWQNYPDSKYAEYFLPSAADPTNVSAQIELLREALRRWPNSPLVEPTRRALAEELVMLTDQSVDRGDLNAAMASAREAQQILTQLSRAANDPAIRSAASEALENAYTEQDVLNEFKSDKNTHLIPFVECVSPIAGGMRAWFGVANPTGRQVSIPVGPKNKMTPAPHDRGQLTSFSEGIRHLAFYVDVHGLVLDWHLDGSSVKAMLDKSFRCPENMDEVLAELPRKE